MKTTTSHACHLTSKLIFSFPILGATILWFVHKNKTYAHTFCCCHLFWFYAQF